MAVSPSAKGFLFFFPSPKVYFIVINYIEVNECKIAHFSHLTLAGAQRESESHLNIHIPPSCQALSFPPLLSSLSFFPSVQSPHKDNTSQQTGESYTKQHTH